MLRLLPKQALKRCMHTTSRPAQSALRSRVGVVAGASAVVTTYVTWRALSEPKIALDSVASSSKPKPTPKAAHTADPVPSQHEPPKAEKSTDAHSASEPKEDSELAPPAVAEADEEAHESQSGAFDPVTGKINWDCPCLGGMAHGPCGMQFREAFSCFVFSEQDPKGIDCVDKFKAMQECFREHPEVYADEIMDDDDDDLDGPPAPQAQPQDPDSSSPSPPTSNPQSTPSHAPSTSSSQA